MKTMTCNQLGGACDKVFKANTFQEMSELSKAHGMEMFQQGDAAHQKVISEMLILMQDPQAMQKWFDSKREEFNNLPQD